LIQVPDIQFIHYREILRIDNGQIETPGLWMFHLGWQT
jgi:hypothetical protein